MASKLEDDGLINIDVIDVDNSYLDIRNINDIELYEIAKVDRPLTDLIKLHQKEIFNIFNSVNINAILLRNLLYFESIVPVYVVNAREYISSYCEYNKICIYNNNIYSIPANTYIKITSLRAEAKLNLVNEVARLTGVIPYTERYCEITKAFDKVQLPEIIFTNKAGNLITDIDNYKILLKNLIQLINYYLSGTFQIVAGLVSETNKVDMDAPVKMSASYEYDDLPATNSKLVEFVREMAPLEELYANEEINSDNLILSAVFNISANRELLSYLVAGKNKLLQKFVERKAITKRLVEQDKKLHKMRIIKSNVAFRYLEIIRDKFDTKLYNKVKHFTDPEDILAAVGNNERKIILSEFKVLNNMWKSILKNKCQHIQLIDKISKQNIPEIKKLIAENVNELQRIDKLNIDEMEKYTCKICKFPLVCPHTVLYYENIDNPDRNIALMNRFGVKSSLYTKYCKICGEIIIQDNLMLTNTDIVESTFDTPLKTFIWGFMMKLLRNVTFKLIVNPSKIANDASNVVFGCMSRYTPKKFIGLSKAYSSAYKPKKVNRNKQSVHTSFVNRQGTNNNLVDLKEIGEDIPNEKKLVAIIFCYAYLFDLMNVNKMSLAFQGVNNNAKANIVAKELLEHAVKTNFNIFNSIQINSTEIAHMFKTAYETVHSNIIPEPNNNLAVLTRNIIYYLMNDHIFKYAYKVAFIVGDIKSNTSDEKAIEIIIGKSVQEIIANNKRIVNNELQYALLHNKVTTKEIEPFDYLRKTDTLNIYKNIYRPTASPKHGDFIKSYLLFADYISSVNSTDKYTKYMELLDEVKEENVIEFVVGGKMKKGGRTKITEFIEEGSSESNEESDGSESSEGSKSSKQSTDSGIKTNLKNPRNLLNLKNPMNKIELKDPKKLQTLDPRKLTKFCIPTYFFAGAVRGAVNHRYVYYDFTLDKFNKNIYRVFDINGDKHIWSKGKCKVCGVDNSNLDSSKNSEILKALSKKSSIKPFFAYYETKCPELTGSHEFSDDETCKFCSFNKEQINAAPSVAAAYYEKYYSKYTADKAASREKILLLVRIPTDSSSASSVSNSSASNATMKTKSNTATEYNKEMKLLGKLENTTAEAVESNTKSLSQQEEILIKSKIHGMMTVAVIEYNMTCDENKRVSINDYMHKNALNYTIEELQNILGHILDKCNKKIVEKIMRDNMLSEKNEIFNFNIYFSSGTEEELFEEEKLTKDETLDDEVLFEDSIENMTSNIDIEVEGEDGIRFTSAE